MYIIHIYDNNPQYDIYIYIYTYIIMIVIVFQNINVFLEIISYNYLFSKIG